MATIEEIAEMLHGLTVTYTAQHVKGEIKVSELHIYSVRESLCYGARRKIQDTINSAAAQCRESRADAKAKGAPVPPEYDAPKEVAAFVVHMVNGTMPARGEGISTLATETFRLAKIAFKEAHGKDTHKALGEKIAAEQHLVLTSFMGDNLAEYQKDAQDSLDEKERERISRAKRIAELLTKKSDVEFDLSKFGL